EEAQEAIETEGKYLTVSAANNDGYSEELRPYFDGLVGMDSVKSQIDKIYKRFKIDAMRQAMLGINAQKQGNYFIMSGNPGTGKTTVARIIAELLYRVGLLPSDNYVEVDRSKLVSQYVGETEKKTTEAIEAARGGTLFIDEAYTLYKKDNANDPGGQAIDVLLKDMEDHRGEYCVIMAGYKKQMSEMVRNANPGLASRFDHHIEIPDYTAEELLQILVKMAGERHFYIESSARNRILEQIEREKVDETFDNARFSRRMFEAALEKQAERLSENIDNLKPEDLQVLKAEDFVPLKASSDKDYLKELDELIGLPGVKEEVRHLVNSAKILIESRNRGLDTADDVIPLNLVFTGNPGTGKTTVARILAKIYTQLGLLKRDDIFIECTRGDLVGEYQGHTAVKVREKVREALGGVLFIDEAYSLRIDDHDSFGLECVNALITEIENNRDKLAVIFAGYTNEMEAFLATNPGLKSRMARTIEFMDYTDEELTEIFFFNMKKRGYTVNADAAFVTDYIAARSHTKDFGNARGVRNLCDDVLRNMKARLIAADDLSALTNEQLTEILPEDFR
ncbi:MAG: AAA family ATPase, partial [Lachnospiraceae bacterium]|nr:AAA family ATPase [Lachnospiraceae bacterium]